MELYLEKYFNIIKKNFENFQFLFFKISQVKDFLCDSIVSVLQTLSPVLGNSRSKGCRFAAGRPSAGGRLGTVGGCSG
jgi:hypothetical protein